MEYKYFLEIIMRYKKISEELNELHDIGVDLYEGKYRIADHVYLFLKSTLESHYTKEGVDWIEWFMMESDYGQKDWSSSLLYNKDGNIIKEAGEVRFGAHDENGNPICYSYETTWEYVKQYEKKNIDSELKPMGDFLKDAEKNEQNRNSVDFSKEFEQYKKIIDKAKL